MDTTKTILGGHVAHEPENTNGCGQKAVHSYRAMWKQYLGRGKLEERPWAPEGFMTKSPQISKKSSPEGGQVDELF